MKLVVFVIIVPLILLAALTAVAYITDRLHIGQNTDRSFNANITPLFSNYDPLYEEFAEFLRIVLEKNCRGLGICRPKDISHIMPPFRTHGIQIIKGVAIFNYEIQCTEVLYGGGCQKITQSTLPDELKADVIAKELARILQMGYSFEKIQVISTPEVMKIKIVGVIYNPLFDFRKLTL